MQQATNTRPNGHTGCNSMTSAETPALPSLSPPSPEAQLDAPATPPAGKDITSRAKFNPTTAPLHNEAQTDVEYGDRGASRELMMGTPTSMYASHYMSQKRDLTRAGNVLSSCAYPRRGSSSEGQNWVSEMRGTRWGFGRYFLGFPSPTSHFPYITVNGPASSWHNMDGTPC